MSECCTCTCPLCGEANASLLLPVATEKIWQGLRDGWGAQFSDAVIARHSPKPVINLVCCRNCGLHYFDPMCPGDPEFYSELSASASAYYNPDRWEFRYALNLLSPKARVLDIACGSGRFLELAAGHCQEAAGIDTNPQAIRNARAKGLDAHCVDLLEFSASNRHAYDAVTAFQVIEHVQDIAGFSRLALACVRPGGRLILSVPNRDRAYKNEFEPLDWPPHHVSRWGEAQFSVLARRLNCRLVNCAFEPAGIHQCRTILRQRLQSFSSRSYWKRAVAAAMFNRVSYGIYRRSGLLDHWRLRGHSVVAVLEPSNTWHGSGRRGMGSKVRQRSLR